MIILRNLLIALSIAVLPFLADATARAGNSRIAVLISSNEAPFTETVAGFRDYLARQGVQADYAIERLDGDAAKTGPAVRRIKAGGAGLVFTVGSAATDAAVKEITDIPIVACLVLRTENLKRSANATGVGLEYPVETQLAWLQRMLPQARSIGVLYNAGENQRTVNAAAEIAKKAGLTLEAERVRSPQDVPAALNRLSKRVDVLWGIPDSVMLAPPIAKNLLLFSFRNSIPFVGPSAPWVKAGALYSLDWDYTDLGGQCGELADRILRGAAPASLPAATPRKVQYSLNLVTARQMKLELPEQLVRGAHQRY
ncbi:MAG: ABC transporter substrate-binding protein [Nitrospirota bacterium]